MDEILLKVKNLTVYYSTRGGVACPVDNVSLEIKRGQVFGLVGESGCGKSTLGFSLMRLLPKNGKVIQGEVLFKGRDLLLLSEDVMNREIRGGEITMIIQDPQNALNPVFTIGAQMADVMRFHRDRMPGFDGRKTKLLYRTTKILSEMGIAAAEERLNDYPFQFSGGMKQRVMIAMAFICNPSLLIADEPTTALDATVEAQILELLKSLVKRYETSVMYITHNLGVISEIGDRAAVMYAGNMVETAGCETLFKSPCHPYTKALLRCVPGAEIRAKKLDTIPGQVPSLMSLPRGCKFHPRCPRTMEVCRRKSPRFLEITAGHSVACFLYDS